MIDYGNPETEEGFNFREANMRFDSLGTYDVGGWRGQLLDDGCYVCPPGHLVFEKSDLRPGKEEVLVALLAYRQSHSEDVPVVTVNSEVALYLWMSRVFGIPDISAGDVDEHGIAWLRGDLGPRARKVRIGIKHTTAVPFEVSAQVSADGAMAA
jgi:hypothetical protein